MAKRLGDYYPSCPPDAEQVAIENIVSNYVYSNNITDSQKSIDKALEEIKKIKIGFTDEPDLTMGEFYHNESILEEIRRNMSMKKYEEQERKQWEKEKNV